MVQAALTLGDRWGVASGLVGALILGPLTSLPNALTGIRLGSATTRSRARDRGAQQQHDQPRRRRGAPVAVRRVDRASAQNQLELALLAAAMLATVGLLAARGGMRRTGAAIVVALYAAFVAATLG